MYGVAARAAGGEERDLTILDQSWGPSLSKDGTFVVMTDGNDGDDYSVVLRRLDRSPPVRLGDGNVGELSPDERWVTANLFSKGQCVVYPTGAGKTVAIDLGPLEKCVSASWFPDGKSLLIDGNEPGKAARAYRVAFPGGKPQALLAEGVRPRKVSPDGKYLLVLKTDGTMERVELGGSSVPVKGVKQSDFILEWSADLQQATVSEQGRIPAVVSRVNLETGERTKVFEVAPQNPAGVLGASVLTFRNEGRDYVYAYAKTVSALYIVNGLR